MPRILALDYGSKRCGLAVTDPLQIIAAPLCTVVREELWNFLLEYFAKEEVETLLIGQIHLADGQDGPLEKPIQELIAKLAKSYPSLQIARIDEAYSSQRAEEVIRFSVKKKKKRQDKSLVDQISAAIILQDYLGHSM